MSKGNSICIKLYLKPEVFADVASEAEKAGVRHKGLLLYTQKPHGFAGEKLANTDDIAEFFKRTFKYWKEHEAERLQELAALAEEERRLQERKKKLGQG